MATRSRGRRTASGFDSAELVRRAATAAAGIDATVLEVGFEANLNRNLFPSDRYSSVALSRPSVPRHVDYVEQQRQRFGTLPVSSERHGLALCTDVIGEAYDPQSVLAELNRALESRSLLFISSPLIVLASSQRPEQRPIRLGLNYLLGAAGFTLQDLTPYTQGKLYGIVAAKTRRIA